LGAMRPGSGGGTGDEGFFQAHAENLSALLDCQKETEKKLHEELMKKLRENLEAIAQDKWKYDKPRRAQQGE